MLNPSTADETKNDPTVERCEQRARQMGCGGVEVVNLFALRSTDPKKLLSHKFPIAEQNKGNDFYIKQVCFETRGIIICAWGDGGEYMNRGKAVEAILREQGHMLYHLGLTKGGHPRHPLYLPYSKQPELWRENESHRRTA